MVTKWCRLRGVKQAVARAILIVLILAVGAGVGRSASAAIPAATKKVLIVSSYSPAYPFYANFTSGLTNRLQEDSSASFQFFHESLDVLRFSLDESFYQNMATILRQKYLHDLPDIIVVNGLPAVQFLRRYGRDIFGDIPVIAATYQPTGIVDLPLPDNYTLCSPGFDAAKNVKLILGLKPNTDKLYVIIGASETERKVREELPEQLAPFSNRLAVISLHDLPFPDILELVRRLDGNAAILFVNFSMDDQGQSFVPIQALRAICAESGVPVFGSLDTSLGGGVVGGYMLNSTSFGRQTAEKTLAVLFGTTPPSQPKPEEISEYMFDWRQLQKWNIDEGRLPPGSIIRYKPVSLWQSYKWSIVGGTVVIMGQAVLIAMLVVNRRRRLRAEKELARVDRLHLVGEIAAGISHEIRNPLTTIRGYLQLWGRRQQAPSPDALTTMISELDRANGIITEFLNLANNKAIQLSLNNINSLVQSLLPILHSEANLRGHDIVFTPGDVPAVLMDAKEVLQVVLNLVMNGLDSMQGHGVVTIRTSVAMGVAKLSVSDQGPGIADEVAKKIGTPFFTTKTNGTGLGLSVCFAIAERHGGRMTFDTGPKGTTFHFFLPLPREPEID